MSRHNWIRQIMLLATLALIVCTPSLARAAHYELFMRYKQDDKVVDLNIDDAPYLLIESASHEAQGLYIRFTEDASAAVTITQLRNVVVLVEIDGKKRALSFEMGKEKMPREAHLLANATQLRRPDKSAYDVRVSVLNKFSSDYLCSIEKKMVRSAGKPQTDLAKYFRPSYVGKEPAETPEPTKSAAKPKAANKACPAAEPCKTPSIDVDLATEQELALYKLLSQHGQLDGAPVLFSYCGRDPKQAGGGEKINWEKVAKQDGGKANASDVQSQHKDALASKVRSALASKLSADVLYQSDGKGRPKNILIRDAYERSIINWLAGDFEVFEDSLHPDNVVRRVVDQASTLVLRPDRRLCAVTRCSGLVETLRVSIDGKDDKGNAYSDTFKVSNQGSYWRLEAALSKYLLQRVQLTIWLKTGKLEHRLASHTLEVENIGLVTTAPIFSEIASLVADPSLAAGDFELKSSIPLSWAYNLDRSEGRLAAVTFPWMLSFNTRAVPRLSDVIKVFPHVTVLLPLARDAETGDEQQQEQGKPQLLLGAGVSLVNAFSLSYGASMTGDAHSNFLLGGVSVPDLVKLFQAKSD